MRCLLCVAGGYGHFHPLAPLARALQAAGHTVAFAVGPRLQPVVAGAGFTVLPLASNPAQDPAYQQVKAQLALLPTTLASEIFAFPRLFCGAGARLRAPGLMDIARAWRPDVMIREGGDYGAPIAAEYLGLPQVTVAFAAALRGQAVFEQEAAAQIDPARAQWGLAPDPTLATLYRNLLLAYAPPSFATHVVGWDGVPDDIPSTTHFIQPEFLDYAVDERLPAWVATLPPQPTIYATLGTEIAKEPEFYPRIFHTLLAGLRDAPINLIITIGHQNDPAEFGPQPPNVHIERYIPQSLLLGACDALIMHGGSNSLLQAFAFGLPVVVIPCIADQFFNAHITRAMGLGVVVDHEQLTPGTIRVALDEIMRNQGYRQRVQALRAEMLALPDQHHAVELIERVVTNFPRVPSR